MTARITSSPSHVHSAAYITPVQGPVYHFTTWCVAYSDRLLDPLHKFQRQRTLCQPFVTTYPKYSPVTNTCVHKSVSSHISLRMPCVYVLACILRMFLGIGGHNSVRHRTASDTGTAVFLTMDPKLGQTTSKLINSLLSSKQPCMLETKMTQDMRFSTQCTKESTVPERHAVSLGKQLSEASQCFYLQAQALLPGLFNTWIKHHDPSQNWELPAHWQPPIPEDLNPQQWNQEQL